jgi:predicted negative regulator of RcsB-dependent stress response
MTRHPAARRLHHTSAADEDAFVARVLQLAVWAKAHARALGIGAAILVLAAAAGLYYVNYQRSVRTLAATELNQVRQTALSGNNALAIRDLEAFITRFASTDAADEARLLLARTYLDDGQPQKAIEAVQALAGRIRTPIGASAAFLLAAAYEAAQDLDKAVATYASLADQAPTSIERQEALQQAARIRMERGDAAAAAELYQRLVDSAAQGTAERALFEMRLAEARAVAARRN